MKVCIGVVKSLPKTTVETWHITVTKYTHSCNVWFCN